MIERNLSAADKAALREAIIADAKVEVLGEEDQFDEGHAQAENALEIGRAHV